MKESLNNNALMLVEAMLDDSDQLRIADTVAECGSHRIDCGIDCRGGLAAGRWLSEVCLGGLGEVCCEPDAVMGIRVVVQTDHPLVACLGGQYAGWKIRHGDYFAIGSGPMRVLANKEELIQHLDRSTGLQDFNDLPQLRFLENPVSDNIVSECVNLLPQLKDKFPGKGYSKRLADTKPDRESISNEFPYLNPVSHVRYSKRHDVSSSGNGE